MNHDAINLRDKLALFPEHWSPRVVAEMNDVQFKLAKLQGEFVWHAHADTDEVFIVIDGEMAIKNTPFVRYSTRAIRVRRKPKIKLML